MVGTLYIIKNKINNKVYIGKTYQHINKRWGDHVKNANNGREQVICRAMRKHGVDNFYVEILGSFEEGILESKEIEYISKYNSYHKGYNSTLGGDGGLLYDLDNEKIKDWYASGMYTAKIAEYYNVSAHCIRERLKSLNIYDANRNNNTPKNIIMYNTEWDRQKIFNSLMEAYKYMNEIEYYTEIAINNFYYYVKKAYKNNNIAFDKRWQLLENTVIKENSINMSFNCSLDKDNYIKYGVSVVENINGIWRTKGIFGKSKIKEVNICTICKGYKNRNAVMCQGCRNAIR